MLNATLPARAARRDVEVDVDVLCPNVYGQPDEPADTLGVYAPCR